MYDICDNCKSEWTESKNNPGNCGKCGAPGFYSKKSFKDIRDDRVVVEMKTEINYRPMYLIESVENNEIHKIIVREFNSVMDYKISSTMGSVSTYANPAITAEYLESKMREIEEKLKEFQLIEKVDAVLVTSVYPIDGVWKREHEGKTYFIIFNKTWEKIVKEIPRVYPDNIFGSITPNLFGIPVVVDEALVKEVMDKIVAELMTIHTETPNDSKDFSKYKFISIDPFNFYSLGA